MKRTLIILAVIIVHCTLLIDNCVCQWVQQSVPVTSGYFNDMKFVNANTGFILVWANPLATFMRTTNAGNNWQILNNWGMSHIEIVDTGCIYASGQNNGLGKLYKSSNLGITWDSMLTTTSYYSYLHFFNRDTGVISGGDSYSNYILRTTNGGQSLQLIAGFGGADPGKFHFLKEKVNGEFYGWIYFSNLNYLCVTTNSGLNWVSKPPIPENVNSVFFVNKDTGWATKNNNGDIVFYTTNGGNNWASQNLPNPSNYTSYDIFFTNARKGWIGTAYNKVFATSTGGAVWGTQYLPISYSGHIFFVDSTTGWNGDGNYLSHTTNGGGTITSILSGSTETQKDYRLYQNYPNPFNPITNVKFSILNAGNVKIIVYDVQGREVQTLVNETLKPGTYEATFDASALPTGIYFYQLFADGIAVQTRKMILLK